MRFGNGLPRQSVPQGHLFRGADWLAMTGFFDSLKGVPKGTPVFYRKYHKGKHGKPFPRRQLVLRRGNLPFLEGKLPHKAACGFYFLA